MPRETGAAAATRPLQPRDLTLADEEALRTAVALARRDHRRFQCNISRQSVTAKHGGSRRQSAADGGGSRRQSAADGSGSRRQSAADGGGSRRQSGAAPAAARSASYASARSGASPGRSDAPALASRRRSVGLPRRPGYSRTPRARVVSRR